MNTQPTRRRRGARAVAGRASRPLAALVATLGAGQALAGPDERILERQGMIDYHAAAIRQALAAEAVPDERILERQGMIDYHTAAIRQALAAEAVPDERILERQGKIGRQAAAG